MRFSDSTPFPKFQPVKTIGRRFKNLTGQRFNRLLVIALAGGIKNRTHWFCKCDCGVFVWASRSNLQQSNNTSCGCRARDLISRRSFQHGLIRSPEWYAWVNMRARCLDPKNISYQNYGGRGISVAKEWLGRGGFQRFLSHVGNKPTPQHSLDRIDNSGNYEPENVRWATRTEQNKNKRGTRWITFDGRTQCLLDWAVEIGISDSALRYRLDKKNYSLERALTMPNQCEKWRKAREQKITI